MAALAVLALALAAAPASAAFKYGSPVPFNVGLASGHNPISAAVDNSTNPSDPSAGSIYVATDNAINRYTPAQAAAGSSTPAAQLSGFSYAWGVAVDPANGNVYATDYEVPSTVRKFDPEGNPLPFNAPALAGDLSNPALSNPAGIAVNPNNGNVLVGDLTINAVYELDSSGAFLNIYYGPSASQGLAVNAAGELFVAAGGSGVVKFTAPGSPYETFSANNGGGVAVDPANQHVFIGGGASAAEFDPAGNQVGDPFGAGKLSDSYGIAVPSGGAHAYVVDNPGNAAFDYSHLIIPDAITEAAGPIAATTATLNGHLDPAAGPEVSACAFAYGTDPNLAGAKTAPCAQAAPFNGPSAASADLTGLNPLTTYYFRLEATNANGPNRGEIKSFQTTTSAPLVLTDKVSDFSATTANLRGTVNPGGLQTSYRFEYGLTASYGSRAPTGGDYVAGNGNQPRSVSVAAPGLQPGTTYHYRLVATNALGTTNGEDRTFTTDPAESCANAAIRTKQGSQRLAECRAYERVSPAENGGVPVKDGNAFGFRATADGNKVVYAPYEGTYPGAEATPLQPRVLATRADEGWRAESLDKPSSSAIIKVGGLLRTVFAVSKDMTRMVIASSRSLGGQGVEGQGNLYIYDADTGDYTLVMTSSDQNFINATIGSEGRISWIGASADLRTIAFETGHLSGPQVCEAGPSPERCFRRRLQGLLPAVLRGSRHHLPVRKRREDGYLRRLRRVDLPRRSLPDRRRRRLPDRRRASRARPLPL